MEVRDILQRLKYYHIPVSMTMAESQSSYRINRLGIASPGNARIEQGMLNSKHTLNLNPLEMAEYYRKGIGFDIKDPATHTVPIYNILVEYFEGVSTLLASSRLKVINKEKAKQIRETLLKDAFVLEAFADALYPLYNNYNIVEERKQLTKDDIVSKFINRTSTGRQLAEERIEEMNNLRTGDLESSPHRSALRRNLDQLTINRYEDYAELGL